MPVPEAAVRLEFQAPSRLLVKPICLRRFMEAARSLTLREALAVLPSPPLVEVTETELALAPAVIPVTVTLKVQLLPAASEPPLSTTVSWTGVLSVVVSVLPAPQTLLKMASPTSKPTGKVSEKATPVKIGALRFGLVIVKFRLVVFPVKMYSESNALAITGGAKTARVDFP